MDDLTSGANTVEGAIQKQCTIHDTLSKAKFSYRQYDSNAPDVFKSIDQHLVEKHKIPRFNDERFVSILGLQRNPVKDEFSANIQLTLLTELSAFKKRCYVRSPLRSLTPSGTSLPSPPRINYSFRTRI